MALTKVSLLDDPLAMSYAANVAGNVSVTRSVSVGYTDGRVPQANLDVKGNTSISGNVAFASSTNYPDSSSGAIGKAVFGTGGDLEIYHDGSHSYVSEDGTGNLYLTSTANKVSVQGKRGEHSVVANSDGSVDLYHDGTMKASTTSSGFKTFGIGANVTGNASVTRSLAVGYTDGRVPQANLDVKGNTYISSNVSLGSSINFLDSSSGEIGKAVFGSPGKDLEIYHNGSHSFIADVGAGQLYLDGSAINLTNSLFTEHYMYMAADAQVQLYYDNSKKFETTSTGVEISGHTKAYQFGTSTGHSLSDDAVLTITNVPIEYGLILIHSVSTDFGIVGFRAQSGAAETYLDFNSSGRIAVTTGILTGTTGTDGKLNISAATNTNLYIENRLGGGTTVGYTLIG